MISVRTLAREPYQPETYRRGNRPESLLRKNVDEFCLRDIIRDGSQAEASRRL